MTMTDENPRSICPTSGKPLFALVGNDGRVIGVCHGGDWGPPSPDTTPRGDRYLPLYGADMPFDLVTEVREGPTYTVEADRVIRAYRVRPKLAAELLREIVWWFGALHSSGAAAVSPAFADATRRHLPEVGMSPSQVNDMARRFMALVRESQTKDEG